MVLQAIFQQPAAEFEVVNLTISSTFGIFFIVFQLGLEN